MNQRILEGIGLTKGESDVYITLLKVGNTTTGALIKESGVSRSKVYEVLERLKQKGLATEMIKENTRYFEATNPNRIVDYLKSKEAELSGKINDAKKVVPELIKLQSMRLEKQEAKVYTGMEGWRTLYNEILEGMTAKDEYLAFGIGKEGITDKQVSLFLRKFHMRRQEKRAKARVIMQKETKKYMKGFSDLKRYQYRFTEVKSPTNIAIYRESVITLVRGEMPLAFVINSKQIADKYRNYFEFLWKISERK